MATEPCTLGCCEHQVFLTNRCGKPSIGLLSTVTHLEYERVLNDTGLATLTVVPDQGADCCERVRKLACWGTEILILRCGEPVWMGPVTNLKFKRDTVEVQAHDLSAWLDVRQIHNDYTFVGTDLAVIVRTILDDALNHAVSADLIPALTIVQGDNGPVETLGALGVIGNDTCLQVDIPDRIGVTADFKVTSCTTYAGDALRELAKIGLDFTVLGRTLYIRSDLSGSGTKARGGTMRDEFFLEDLEIEERGQDAVTLACVTGQSPVSGGDPVTASCGDEDAYYGLIEQLGTLDHTSDAAAIERAACSKVAGGNPPPIFVNVPEGAKLDPAAPICFDQLVPGAIFDFFVRAICKQVTQPLRLSHVRITDDSDTGEQIGVGFGPIGTTGREIPTPEVFGR